LPTLRVSSLAVKFPGTKYRLPNELNALTPALVQAAGFEQAINPDLDRYYAYLTAERTWVEGGQVQRGPAIHSDGIQGPRIQPKAPVERGYLAVDCWPPRFFTHGFDVTGVDPDQHLLDRMFTAQADSERSIVVPINTLIAFDSYAVHQAVSADRSGWRSFVRIAFSTRKYDRLGNTINPAFADEYLAEQWHFQPRPLPNLPSPPRYR
jgi:hypothetical protein